MSREMKHSGIPWIGDIPKGWNIDTIGNLYTLRNEKVSDKDYPPLSVSKMGVVPQLETAAKTDDGDNRKLVRVGDFAINSRSDRRGSCGISAYDGSVSLINTVITPREQMNPRFYNWLFHSELFADEFYKWGHGIVDDLWTTRWQEMKHISIVAPSLEEQQKIASFLDRKCAEIDEMIALQEKIIEELKAYKQSVITEAVTKGLNPDVPMKDSGIEWIGEIPEHWEAHPFKAFYKTTKGLNITKDNLVESGIPVISYGQIHSKQNTGTSVSEELIRYVPADYIDSNPECLSKKYDIFFADTSEDREGAGNIALIDVETPIFAGYHTIMAHPSDRVKSKYIAYLIKTDAWRCQLRCKVQGVKLFSISQKFVNQTSIIVPPISEQIQISEYLDAKCTEIDNLISIKLSKIDSLKEYKKSIIYEYVTGKKEVTE